jgi:DNA adenine methylase
VDNPTRPLLRYFGGKWRIAPWVLSFFPKHRIYCEPFGGGASLLLQKPRAYGEIYNDLDGEVVNVFRVMQRNPRKLRRLLEATPFARAEFDLSILPVRDPVERARRAIMRSFMGFGSDSVTRLARTGFRSNSNRSGTTPAHDWATWPDQIPAFHHRLAGVVIENRDALEVMASQDSPETLHYVDPPYVHSTRSIVKAKHGYRHEMDDLAHARLLDFLGGLKGMVLLSGYEHPMYAALGWRREALQTFTFRAENRGSSREEILLLNPAASSAQEQLSLISPHGKPITDRHVPTQSADLGKTGDDPDRQGLAPGRYR